MKQLTEKRLSFVNLVLEGMKPRQAGLEAGYSPNGIDQSVSTLMAHPAVKAAIRAGKRKGVKLSPIEKAISGRPKKDADDSPKMLPKYESSLALLRHTYNNPRMSDTARIEAAKQALPYEHARIGEKGKKESAKDNAKELVSRGRGHHGPTRSPKVPPKLHSIQGGKH